MYIRDVVRIFVSFLSFYFRYIISYVHWSCDHLVIAFIVLIFDIYIYMMLLSRFTYLYMCCFFFSLYTCFLYDVCNLIFLFHTKMP